MALTWTTVVSSTLAMGCQKFTNDQAVNVIRKCLATRTCHGGVPAGVEVNLAPHGHDDATRWDYSGHFQFVPIFEGHPPSHLHENCSTEFKATVSIDPNNATAKSADPIVAVRLDPESDGSGPETEKERCYYFLDSGKLAEK